MEAWAFGMLVILIACILYYFLSRVEDYIDENDGYFDESYKAIENKDVSWDEVQLAIKEEVEKNKKQTTFVKCEYCGTTNKIDQLKCNSCGAPLIKL